MKLDPLDLRLDVVQPLKTWLVSFICIAQQHKSHISLRGFYDLYSSTASSVLRPLTQRRKNSYSGEKVEKTSGRVAEEF